MKKVLKFSLIGLFAAAFVFAGYQVAKTLLDYHQSQAAYEDLADTYLSYGTAPAAASASPEGTDASADETEGAAAEGAAAVPAGTDTGTGSAAPDLSGQESGGETAEDPLSLTVDFEALKQVNEDIVAWIYCPDTVISYPVLQSADNSDYLRHLPDGTYRQSGSLFIDCDCDGFLGLNTVIYGHNLNDGSMFASLVDYKKQSYYDAHPRLYLFTETEKYVLKPIAGFVTSMSSESYDVFETEEALQSYLQGCMSKSTFSSGADVSQVERIITLSTCEYSSTGSRYVLVCEPVPVGEA